MNVHASLSADAHQDKVLVTFRIENRGERRIWLPRAIAADTALAGPLFRLVRQPDGAAVPYVGTVQQQGAPDASDYVELPPHSAHTHTLAITSDYAFAPGEHDYELRYAGVALADIHLLDATTALAPAPVVFRHTA